MAFLDNARAMQAFHLMRQGSIILLAIFLARSNLTESEIGLWEQLNYVGYTLSFFWVTGLVQGMLTRHADLSVEERRRFYRSAYYVFLALGILTTVAGLLFERPLALFLTTKGDLQYLPLYLVYMGINLPTYLVENFYLLEKRPKGIVLFGLFAFGLQLVVVLTPVLLGYEFIVSFYGLIGLGILKHFWLLGWLWKNSHSGEVDLQPWLWLSLPLMGYALMGGLIQSSDGWVVNYWFKGDEGQFALFRYGAREFPLSVALASALSAALLPEISSDMALGLKTLRVKSLRLMHWLFPLSAVLLLSSHWFFPLVFRPGFEESAAVFNTFLLILIPRMVFARTVLIGLKDNVSVLWFSGFELVANLILSLLLVAPLGINGVAIGTFLAFVLEKVLMVGRLVRKHGVQPKQYFRLDWWCAYSLLLLFVYYLVDWSPWVF